ncbi:unnamed protein product [Cochlearia groenlandica]
MIPTRSHHEINGSRPPSLKLAGESHSINKKTPCNAVKPPRRHGQRAGPVIIYAHSPKVIHTHAEDFMALVQRLTGLEEIIRRNPNDVNEPSSSVVTEEVNVCDDDTCEDKKRIQRLADIPLFTPGSMSLFGSPNQLRYLSPNRTDPV